MISTNPLLRAALWYAEHLGWPVLPLHSYRGDRCTCGNVACQSPAKHPCCRNGLYDATTDVDQICEIWRRTPSANIGIRTGEVSGIVAIDIDPRHSGDACWEVLTEKHGKVPATVEAITGGNGTHLIFAYPGFQLGNRAEVAPGIDVRGDGGYLVAAPSLHWSGQNYAWRPGRKPSDLRPAPLPEWLLELIKPPETSERAVPANDDLLLERAAQYVAAASGVAEGSRNNTAFSLAGHLAAFQTEAGIRLSQNQIVDLLQSWNARNRPPLIEQELIQVVQSACQNGQARASHVVKSSAKVSTSTKPTSNPKKIEVSLTANLPFRPFPVEALPAGVRNYALAVAATTGTDPCYAALAVLVVIAGCLGNRVSITVKSGWTEPSVLWGTIVGRSGATKTPVLKIVTKPLHDIYKAARKAYVDLCREHERDLARYAVDLAKWKRENKGETASDPPDEPESPKESRIVVSDITVEKLGALLQQNPLGLLLVRDELAAWVGSFDRYSSGGKGSDQPSWLSMYDASSIVIDRKSDAGTTFVERAAVSVLGSIQPATLARLFGRSEREAGLLARILVVYPPERPSFWTDSELPEAESAQWRALLDGLLGLAPGVDESGNPRPRYIPFSAEAKRLWIEWHDQHAREIAECDNDDLSAHFAKLKGACARLALIVTCIEVVEKQEKAAEIGCEQVKAAIALVEWFKYEGRRVYGMLGESDDQADNRKVIDLILRRGGQITPRELQQNCRRFKTSVEDAEAFLAGLVEAGIGSWKPVPADGDGGRHARLFILSASDPVYETSENQLENDSSVDVDSVDDTQLPSEDDHFEV